VQVLAQLGLGMLLFLAGLEIDVDRLRGPLSRLAGEAFVVSAALAVLCAVFFWLAVPSDQPLLLAIAEVVPILLLSLFFSAAAKTTADQLVSLAIFLALLVLIGLALTRVRRLRALDRLLDRLEERSGQLRVRAALTLALGCGVLAYRFGFASILGAFAAGLLVRLVEVSGREPNELFLTKLEGIGFGFLIPIFFISVGVGFNLKDLLNHPSALVEVPLFLVALLVVRGVPALLYRRVMDTRHAAAAGLMQATTLTFVIVAAAIGRETGKLTSSAGAALVTAGLLSAALFPAAADRVLAHGRRAASAGSGEPPRSAAILRMLTALPGSRTARNARNPSRSS
jgi:Kef-type K+ transport system membrane component KefB